MCVFLKAMMQKCHFKLVQLFPIALFVLVAGKIAAVIKTFIRRFDFNSYSYLLTSSSLPIRIQYHDFHQLGLCK